MLFPVLATFMAVTLAAYALVERRPRGLGRLAGILRGLGTARRRASKKDELLAGIKRWRERRALGPELERALPILIGALRAGMSVPLAVEHTARQLSGPLRAELEEVIGEYRMGVSLSRALQSWKQKANSRDVALVIAALEVMREVGGTMTEPLVHLAQAIRRRNSFRREVWAKITEARMSTVVVAAVPPLLACAMSCTGGDAWGLLLSTSAGNLILMLAFCLWLSGLGAAAYVLLKFQRE